MHFVPGTMRTPSGCSCGGHFLCLLPRPVPVPTFCLHSVSPLPCSRELLQTGSVGSYQSPAQSSISRDQSWGNQCISLLFLKGWFWGAVLKGPQRVPAGLSPRCPQRLHSEALPPAPSLAPASHITSWLNGLPLNPSGTACGETQTETSIHLSVNVTHEGLILIKMSRKRTVLWTQERTEGFLQNDFQAYPKFWNVLKSNLNSYLQDVKLAAFVILHIKVVDGELNAAPRGCANVPDTLFVGGVRVRVSGAAEGAGGPRQFRTTTC